MPAVLFYSIAYRLFSLREFCTQNGYFTSAQIFLSRFAGLRQMLNESIILSIPIGLSNCVLSPKQGLILETAGNKIHSSLQQQEKIQ